MAKKKTGKQIVYYYSRSAKKPTGYDLEMAYTTEKEAMDEALMDLDRNEGVTLYKAEIKKVGTFKNKLVKL
jgi:hypothetical protein